MHASFPDDAGNAARRGSGSGGSTRVPSAQHSLEPAQRDAHGPALPSTGVRVGLRTLAGSHLRQLRSAR
jgi:hypothetical protein